MCARSRGRPGGAGRFLRRADRGLRGFRFFSAGANVEAEADRAVNVDYADRYSLIATRGEDGRSVGHSAYFRSSEGRAEIAFAVSDELQGRGLGTILLAHLAEVAIEHGIDTFEAKVLPENHRMIEVFRESGFPVEVRSVPGSIQVELPTSFTSEAVERFEDRDRVAAAAAVNRFFEPRSVAVIGASRQRETVGWADLSQPPRWGLRGRRLSGEPRSRGRPISTGL